MPSCIVKTCRNNSMVCKKESGVTFHKFPKDMNWKYKWIKVIRACRSEESWLPSPFSVVCSAHFADGDIYKTQGGNRRITKNAVPTLKLYDVAPKKKKGDYSMPVESVTVSVQTAYSEQSDDNETISGERQNTTGEPGDTIQSVIIKVEPTELIETTADSAVQTVDQGRNVTIKVEPTQEQPRIEISIDPLAPQQYDDTDSEEFPGLVSDSTSYYEHKLKKKNYQLMLSRKKIKILHQKISRLQSRNVKLKNILKEIRYKKLIDREVFKKLTATLINNDA